MCGDRRLPRSEARARRADARAAGPTRPGPGHLLAATRCSRLITTQRESGRAAGWIRRLHGLAKTARHVARARCAQPDERSLPRLEQDAASFVSTRAVQIETLTTKIALEAHRHGEGRGSSPARSHRV